MAFNGAGVFVRLFSWLTDKAGGIPVTASRMDQEMDGFATGLSTCIARDGQSTISAAIPWNSQNLTGVGVLTVTGTTASTSTTTGAVIISGGAGVAGRVSADNFRATNQPCFSAHKNTTDQTGIATTTTTKITFTTEVFDIGSFYTAADSKWTPPAGMVQITACVAISNQTNDTTTRLDIYKNGSSYKRAITSSGGAPVDGLTITIVDRANGTDYYEVYITGSTASTLTVSGLTEATYFMGFQL